MDFNTRISFSRNSPTSHVLSTGTRLGPYEILSALGAGGMGEVYKARDTRLDRIVAIKILPDALAADPQFRDRFEREARTVAALNHPHICTLHDVGHQDSTAYLVMEYLDGETLASRLQKGALPLAQVLAIGVQIADALDRAHQAGIIHRDLKPGNVMVTRVGAKLLDFGLAKSGMIATSAAATMVRTQASPLTAQGTILGTFQYMAPEQLEGCEADARSDIFAFGATLYEMVTGHKAFEGKSQASLISAIMSSTPASIATALPMTPAALDHLVKACLSKDPDERIQTAHDVLLILRWIAQDVDRGSAIRPREAVLRPSRVTAALVGMSLLLALISTAAAVVFWKDSRTAGQPAAFRFVLSEQLPSQHRLPVVGTTDLLRAFAISRDGRKVVYSSEVDGVQRLYLRNMEALQASAIADTENAVTPFFSPDGQRIGFVADNRLKIVSIAGGAPVTLAEVANPRGAVWATDDTIVYSPATDAGLWSVPAGGGTPRLLTAPDPHSRERSYRWPELVPGGNGIVFTAVSSDILSFDDARLMVRSLKTSEQHELLRGGSFPVFASSGHLLYARAGALLAVRFNKETLALEGTPTTVLDGVVTYPLNGAAQFALSADGTLLYVPGRPSTKQAALTWIDRAGRSTHVPVPIAPYQSARISPDGRFAAVDIDGANASIWLFDLARAALTRFTTEWSNNQPFWSADGTRVAFSSARGGVRTLFWQPADGSSGMEPLTPGGLTQNFGSWSPDGETLAFDQLSPGTGWDIWMMSKAGRHTRPLVQTTFAERAPRFAPNGHWLAYVSDEGGRQDIYVQPFPGPGRKMRVSPDGGRQPEWSRDGRELFYLHVDGLMAVAINGGAELSAGTPQLLIRKRNILSYDVGSDGRFLVIEDQPLPASAPIAVVINWTREMQTRLQLTAK